MASFIVAFARTDTIEGGYVNDEDDPGGETYRGVARHYWPGWEGWKLIDSRKSQPGFPEILRNSPKLDHAVAGFYKEHFWDPLLGDHLTSQPVAEELYDTAVNMGVKRAATFFQVALNAMNRNGRLYPDLRVDGKVGTQTVLAYRAYRRADEDWPLLKLLNIQQGHRYLELTIQTPVKEKYLRGWLRRVELPEKRIRIESGTASA